MKKLFINNTIAVIDDNQKFYFQHKVNNLDDYSIINLPVSKTIQVPRCQQNDEIFGYIGEIQRLTFNYDNDEKVSISYNQTKKVGYEFYDGSELISSGNLIVDNITQQNYEVTLYDGLINTLEELSGDEDGNGYLNSLDIYYAGTNDKIEFPINSANLPYYAYINDNLKYTINIKDDDLTDTSFRCIDKATNSPKTFELSEELTQLQAKSVKSYDVEYAVPVNGVIESINKKYNNIVEVDSKLSTYFDELHFSCGKAKKYDKTPTEISLNSFTGVTAPNNSYPYTLLSYPFGDQANGKMVSGIFFIPLKDLSNNFITKTNGKYYLELPIQIKTSADWYDGPVLSKFNGKTFTNSNVVNGDLFMEWFLKTKICNYIPGVRDNLGTIKEYNVTEITNKIQFIYGVSASIVKHPTLNSYQITYTGTLVLEYDFNKYNNTDKLGIYLDITYPQRNSNCLYGGWANDCKVKMDLLSGGKLIQTPSDKIENGDIINGKNIYPKISIKDFLVNLSKYHNLNIKVINNKINISKKLYVDQNDIVQIANVNSINPKLFDFSKLQISYEVPDNDLVNKNYLEINKQKYGQKNIDLNYTIKKTIKKVEYPISIPALMRDTSKLGYDTFLGYYNGGRSKYTYGVTNGFSEKIVFGFLNKINETIVLCDDTWFELGCVSTFETNIPTEKSIVKSNMFIENNGGVYSFNLSSSKGYEHAYPVTQYYTVSPYLFNTDGTIKKSLEINKPKYNYANITDSNYTEDVTHYNKYLKNFVEEIYNVNNHILDCDIILDSQVDINKIYHYHNVNYIINEIPEYDPTYNYIKGVKLLKVNDKNNYLYPYCLEEGNITINSYSSITQAGMTINERINYTGGDTIVTGGVRYSTNPNNLSSTKTISNPTTTFSVSLTGLTKNTLYYIQPYMISATGIYTYGEIYQKMTLDDYSVPTVNMLSATNIAYTAVNAAGNITSAGGYPTTEYGFVYSSVNQFPTTSDSKKVAGTGTMFGAYGTTITGLTAGTTYYIRAYTINQNGTGYSSNQSIITTNSYLVPTLSTTTPTGIRQRDGYSGGYNLNENGDDIIEKGIVISTTFMSDPTVNSNLFKFNSGSGLSDYTTYFSSLQPNKIYKIRAFATNGIGTGYGELKTFTTLLVQTADISLSYFIENLTTTGGGLSAIMTHNGGEPDEIMDYGFILSQTNSSPTDGGTDCVTYWSAQGPLFNNEEFTAVINDLTSNTTYYYRAIVYNSAGAGYSDTYQFTTLSSLPTIQNHSLSRVSDYDTQLFLNFDITGNFDIFEYGVIFSNDYTDPTFDDSEHIGWWNDGPRDNVSTTFSNEAVGWYTVGSYYCKMYILTPLGYIYSSVVNDAYLV